VTAALDVRCEGLVHIYPSPDGDEVVALRGLDLDVAAGEAVALLGPSGCGKSTLLSLMAGLLRPSAGRLTVGGTDVGRLDQRRLMAFRSGSVGTVLQGAARNLLPYASAVDNVELARSTLPRGRRREARPARELLDLLGLARVREGAVATLSGGEQQRVAIAVALANSPGLLLADEPTSQLDHDGRDEVLDALTAARQQLGTTVVVVTHDVAVGSAADRTVRMRDGRVGAEGRLGHEHAVVGTDGTLHIPDHLLEKWPPGTLVRVDPDGDDGHLHVRKADG
jgi:ABC-type lipoprotein export system ATPase subunit